MERVWDALIVGAGPAGASAAYFLGEAGLRALVLEAKALPRDKVCGGAVPHSAFRLFPFDFEPVIEDTVHTVHYAWLDKEASTEVAPGAVTMVHRREFDAFILSHAKAQVLDRTRIVEVEEGANDILVRSEDGRSWYGRYLLIAEGSTGGLARRLGLNRGKTGVPTLEAEVPLSQVNRDLRGQGWFQFGALPGGYLWVFPKREHVSAGIVAFRRVRRPLRQVFEAEMARIGVQLNAVMVRGHPLPVYGGRRAYHRRRILLLGDAANLVDPLVGEGVRYALHSGKVAADIIAAGLPPSEYTNRVSRELGLSLGRAKQIAVLFYGLPRFGFGLATCSDEGTRWMTGIFSESCDYVALSHRLLRLAFSYVTSKAVIPKNKKSRRTA